MNRSENMKKMNGVKRLEFKNRNKLIYKAWLKHRQHATSFRILAEEHGVSATRIKQIIYNESVKSKVKPRVVAVE